MLKNRTFIITGASRGIGKAIALRLAKEGANIVIASKSVTEDPRLGGTIYSAAEEVEKAGGQALAVPCDIRFEDQIQEVISKTVERFGGIDGLINNASAISLTSTETTETKRLDLIYNINVRGTFLMTKHSLPYLKKSENAHILNLSPPLNITPKWLKVSVPYSISKFNMSMMILGWAEEFRKEKIAANALWPVTTIATAAVQNIIGGDLMISRSRRPEIMADAAFHILSSPSEELTGQLLLDEQVLKNAGFTDLTNYAITPGGPLQKDLFI